MASKSRDGRAASPASGALASLSFRRRRAFTLVELLVVIAIIGTLVGLLLPAVQAAREAARRSTCGHNLKQIGVACHTFVDQKSMFPPGAVGNNAGYAWFVMILPNLELREVYDTTLLPTWDQFRTNCATVSGYKYGSNNQPGNLDATTAMKNMRTATLVCPSSPLPQVVKRNNATGTLAPSYAAVAGASDTTFKTVSTNLDRCPDVTRSGDGSWSLGSTRCAACTNGVINSPACKTLDGTAGTPQEQIWYGGGSSKGCQPRDITDGLTKTLLVGEQSTWGFDGTNRNQCRASGIVGWFGGGYCYTSLAVNTAAVSTSRHVGSTVCGSPLYSANDAGYLANGDPYTPFRSAHGVGAQFAMADGAVRWVDGTIDNLLYRLLAIRDSGQAEAVPE